MPLSPLAASRARIFSCSFFREAGTWSPCRSGVASSPLKAVVEVSRSARARHVILPIAIVSVTLEGKQSKVWIDSMTGIKLGSGQRQMLQNFLRRAQK